MNHLHLDSVGGASGDMILAALLDLGVDKGWVEESLSALGVGRFGLNAEPSTDKGIRGLRLSITLPDYAKKEHSHSHHHGNGFADILGGLFRRKHEHGHSRLHEPGRRHAHENNTSAHRGLAEIADMLQKADLPPEVRENSLRVFGRIAETEARVHATTVDRIHFHEVGALDSIADIVGCHLCLHKLAVDRISVAPLPIGRGSVTCAHGILPLPAPATAELLKGFPVFPIDEEKETVTPTGAALLSSWKNRETPPASGAWTKIGHGLGRNEFRNRPNLLRAFLYSETTGAGGSEDCLVLECNLDDLTPELAGSLTTRLLQQGALDAFMTPVFMKKQRPGMLLTVLCRPEQRDAMLDLVFRESTTFGIRERREARTVLERHFETVPTPYGPIRIKIGTWRGKPVTASPEHSDCAAAAERAGAPVKAVWQAALAAHAPRG